MRAVFITILFVILITAVDALAADVLILQSMRVQPFEEALRGFRSVAAAGTRTIVVTGVEEGEIVRAVRTERPRLVVTIGTDALRMVRRIKDIPIIYLMVLNPEKVAESWENIAGIGMNIPPRKYLSLMEGLKLTRMKVGIFYDTENSGTLVKRIRESAVSMGIEIEARRVRSPKEVLELIGKMKGSCNVFWMLPDPTVVTPETVEFLLLYALENRMPVVTFSGKYVDKGALASLGIDCFDMGKQAGEMANRVLSGADISRIGEIEARSAVFRVNSKVAEKLNIDISAVENRRF